MGAFRYSEISRMSIEIAEDDYMPAMIVWSAGLSSSIGELMNSVLKLPCQGIRASEQFDIAAENMLSVRHSKFVALRDDKKPSQMLKEG
jgi:hypothetical protein